MNPFIATYRLQLDASFPLGRALEVVPYLHRLGVSHVYASPVLAARPGSTHGYDVTDPTRVAPELGGDEAWRALGAALGARGLGLLLDIVPNHMAVGEANPFWDDVLTYGRESRYARWFDIDWDVPDPILRGRVMLSVLADRFSAVLARDELRVVYEGGRFRVRYWEHSFPLHPATVHRLFAFRHEYDYGVAEGGEHGDAARMLEVRDALIPEGGAALDRQSAERAVAELAALVERSPAQRAYVNYVLDTFSRGQDGRYRLAALLDLQSYTLTHWRRAAKEINYRRFFDINELVALRVEDPGVFAATHALVLGWVGDGSIDGLRIDHVDGLLDPLEYLTRLRAAVRERRPEPDGDAPFPIVVEKILSSGEHLRDAWPVQGTTGYEFLNDVEAIFLDPAGAAAVEQVYRQALPVGERRRTFHEVTAEGKHRILRGALAADVRRLARQLHPIARRDARTGGLRRADLATAIVEYVAALPVYRSYVDGRAPVVDERDRAIVEQAMRRARERGMAPAVALDLLEDVLLLRGDPPPDEREARLGFVLRLQQASGPVMAKGVEDTAFYRFVPLLSRNEVGGEPDRPLDDAPAVLHAANQERAERWPLSLLATSTHDTKRSADVRARLDVLTELPELWRSHIRRWMRAHRALGARIGPRRAPDANTTYLFYQTLAGIWPIPPADAPAGWVPDAATLDALHERVASYMLKAAREGKARTSWTDPDEAFEAALGAFVAALVLGEAGARFRGELGDLVARIARPGLWNALSRTVVHLTAPGTPDIYRGDELWSFTLVDPDNRRPVDFAIRARLLAEVEQGFVGSADERTAFVRALIESPEDGRVKLHVIHRALQARRARPTLFRSGSYEPLAADGARAGHLFAFARRRDDEAAVVVASRLVAGLARGSARGSAPVGSGVWGDTVLRLPPTVADGPWECLLTGRRIEPRAGALRLGDVLHTLPVALLVRHVTTR